VHQVGHWLRLYEDARSAKHQKRRITLTKIMQTLALDVTEWFVLLLASSNFVKISYLPKTRSGRETPYSVSLRIVENKEFRKYAPRTFPRL
jgi:hypothetical protein